MPRAAEDGPLAAADKLGSPWPSRPKSPAVLHKTDAGAVVLDIKNRAGAASAMKQIAANLEARVPGAEVHHFLIEKMMPSRGSKC